MFGFVANISGGEKEFLNCTFIQVICTILRLFQFSILTHSCFMEAVHNGPCPHKAHMNHLYPVVLTRINGLVDEFQFARPNWRADNVLMTILHIIYEHLESPPLGSC